ncbi:hypothetical protein [uncultured Bacteroides sp.]|uniref:hypothetical protein n=1 Tax=uncultured Bacteroides sp. TaxID=162156 RepID=UPI0025D0F0A4|nr:hypothetical protein [uncultured Bacteroides sp.]
MIKATVICGGSAVREYDEYGKIPTDKWLEDHGGVVDDKQFNTPGEYDAYSKGLADAADWDETILVNKTFARDDDASTDCKHCKEWRAIFCDREHDVYCPDCGKLILHPEEEVHEGEQE